jgi:hypothetical protein
MLLEILGRAWTELIGSGQGQVASCCELGDKSLGF